MQTSNPKELTPAVRRGAEARQPAPNERQRPVEAPPPERRPVRTGRFDDLF